MIEDPQILPAGKSCSQARILGVGTALPPYALGQAQAQELARGLFCELPQVERLIGVFANTGIAQRYLARPPEWYTREHSFPEKNRAWFEAALELSLEASRKALLAAGKTPQEVAGVVFVSTTGIATPSPEAYLVQALGIPPSAIRLPLWGLGCAGGAAGLARSADLARLHPGRVFLLVTVELCSLTFIPGDRSKSNLVATSLFADGAAAVVLGAEGIADASSTRFPSVLGGFTRLLPDSYEVMGWDLHPQGLQVRFARSIPTLVQRQLPRLVREGLEAYGFLPEEIDLHVLHPGGAKVLAAYQEALGSSPESLAAAWEVLREYGNMSSPTVLFVLERLMGGPRKAGEMGLLLALGPGFALEGVLLRW
ncbi:MULTISPECIES: type III polyketide synthase [unclassified Meiothermus]|uniref:type III polyketide synthase n=1 Tax=unclassified Meiothermus TaxID=370471 RepID=UPI000D7C2510|nr:MULTISPECIES: 3-oxoacyl-[acyl-carrier-protein] synthase III C-terminal domain-containing protein [unclassified Meiothermus]PZA07817.1 stilbene synthase [Meiothermus sp. Pnk-1]RYM38880.1 stilbene synthase [Meiothermus sp. PNK-Is4]